MRDTGADELIALAGAVSIEISRCMKIEELTTLLEFLGLLKHNLEVIKWREITQKLEDKKDKDKDKDNDKNKD